MHEKTTNLNNYFFVGFEIKRKSWLIKLGNLHFLSDIYHRAELCPISSQSSGRLPAILHISKTKVNPNCFSWNSRLCSSYFRQYKARIRVSSTQLLKEEIHKKWRISWHLQEEWKIQDLSLSVSTAPFWWILWTRTTWRTWLRSSPPSSSLGSSSLASHLGATLCSRVQIAQIFTWEKPKSNSS